MKKMNWKRRMISAALALSMVASFLPAGIFDSAKAIMPTDASTLTLNADGTFTATFLGSAPDLWGDLYFALVPNIGVNGSSVLSTVTGNAELSGGSNQNLAAFKKTLEDECGITWTSACYELDTNKMVDGENGVTITTTSVVVRGDIPTGDWDTNYPGHVKGNGKAQYVACLWNNKDGTDMKYVLGDYNPSGLVVEPDHIDIVYNQEAVDDALGTPTTKDPYWEVNTVDKKTLSVLELTIKNLGSSSETIRSISFEEANFSALVTTEGDLPSIGFELDGDGYVVGPSFPKTVTESEPLYIDMFNAAEKGLTGSSGKGTLVIWYGSAANPKPLRVPFTMKKLTGYTGTGTVELWKDGKLWNDGVGDLPTVTLNGGSGAPGAISGSGTHTVTFADLNEGTYPVYIGTTDTGKTITIEDGNTAAAKTVLNYYTYELKTSDATAGSVKDGKIPSVDFDIYPVDPTPKAIAPKATANDGYRFSHWEDDTGTTVTAPTSLTKKTVLTAHFEKIGIQWQSGHNPAQNNVPSFTVGGTAPTWTTIVAEQVGTGTLGDITYTVTGTVPGLTITPTKNVGVTITGTPNASGTYTVTVRATADKNGNYVEESFTINVGKETLPKPTGTGTDPSVNNAKDGSIKLTNKSSYPNGTTFTLSKPGDSTFTPVTLASGADTWTGLGAGTYVITADISAADDKDNYSLPSPNSDNIVLNNKEANDPTVETGSNTYERNDTERGAGVTYSYGFTTGNWDTVKAVSIGSVALTKDTHWTVSGSNLVLDADALDNVPGLKPGTLANGNYSLNVTFSDSAKLQADKTITTGKLAIKTTYVLNYLQGDSLGGATLPTTPVKSVVTDGDASKTGSFSYAAATAAGYTFDGWSTNGDDGVAEWTTGNPWSPAVTALNSNVYACWTANKPEADETGVKNFTGTVDTAFTPDFQVIQLKVDGNPSATYTYPDGLPDLSTAYGLTLKEDTITPGRIIIQAGTPTHATTGEGPITFSFKAKADNGAEETFSFTVTVKKKSLTAPVIVIKNHPTAAGTATGAITLNAPNPAYPTAAGVTYVLVTNGTAGAAGSAPVGDIGGLYAGDYNVKATIAKPNDYKWGNNAISGEEQSALSNQVKLTDPGVKNPTVSKSPVYEKNKTGVPGRTTPLVFDFYTGDWTRVDTVDVGGTPLTIGTNTNDCKVTYNTATEGTERTGTISIPADSLDGLGLANGNVTVTVTFKRDGGTTATQTKTATGTLQVQTTYIVSFADYNDGALSPNVASISKVCKDATIPTFAYSNIGLTGSTTPAKAGYTFAGWTKEQKTAPTTGPVEWSSASATSNYKPGNTSSTTADANLWNTKVYATWTANVPTGTPANLSKKYGDDVNHTALTVSTPGLTGSANTSGYTYSDVTVTGTIPTGLVLSFGGKPYVSGTGSYSDATNVVTVTGKPAQVTASDVTVSFKVIGPTGGVTATKTFTISVGKATPTFDVTDAGGTHHGGDATVSSVNVAVSGPYYKADPSDPTKYDPDNWVTLTQDSTDPTLILTYDPSPSLIDDGTHKETVKVTGSVDTTGGNLPLGDVWTKDYDDAVLNLAQTYTVTVKVYKDGAADSRYNAKAVTGITGRPGVMSGNTATITNVPAGTYTIAITDGPSRTVRVSGDVTVNFLYYTVRIDNSEPNGDGTIDTATADVEVLVGGAKNSVALAETHDLNYALKDWTQTPAVGTFGGTGGYGTWTINGTYNATTGVPSNEPNPSTVKGPIVLKPSFKTTGHSPKVTIRLDNATDATGAAGVKAVELWSQAATPVKVYTAPTTGVATFTGGVATFTNITPGTYHIYVNNGSKSADSGIDLTTSTANTNVDFYRLKFTTPATQKHYADSWSNTIGADKTVTAKATVFGTADTALSNNDPVLKGTAVAFEVADWGSADYTLSWAVATAGTGRTASYTVNGTMANPVVATLTQNVYPVTGKTDKTTHGGDYAHVTNVKYAVTRTGGDGTTLATLSPSYNTTSGDFTTPATSLTGSAGMLPAGFTYALTAATSDDTKTIIREYKVGTGGTPVAYPGPLSFNVTKDGGDTQPEPWIVLEGAVFSFVLSNDYVDKDNYTVATGKDWGSVTFGYPQPALQTVTIVNTGNRPLEHVTVDPMPGSGFVAKDLTPTTIPVGGTATFTVQPVTGLRVNGGTAHTQRYTVKADYAANKTYDARLVVIPAEMDYATVTIDRPVEGNAPATTASITDEYATAGSYSVESITWGVVGGGTMPATFQAGGQYQVTLVLSPDGDHIFVDESKNHPAPDTVAYKVNGAVFNGTGTDGGRLVTRTVNNTTHKVTLVYQFTTLKAGLPAPSMVPLTYNQGKLTQITATSSDEVNFYYVILPDGEAVPTAQAIYDAATDPTNKPIANQVVSDKAPSGASSGGKVTWNAGKVFNGDPGKTYNVYVVARPKTGGDLSEVNTTSVTLPKKLTITIKKVGSTTTVTGPAYPTVNSTTGANTTGNLTLNSTISATIPALSMRGPYTFTASPDLIAETTAPGYNIPGAWALKQVEVRRGATDAAATAATGTDKDVRNLANIDYGWAAPVTQIDVTFRQRIVNKPIISGNPTLGSTLTATVGSGASQVTIGDTKVVTFNGTDPNFGSDLLFQWQWNDGGTWRDIEDSTGAKADKYQWTVTPEHSGHSFRVMVTYNREEDRGISGRGSTVASDPTETKNQKLDAPTVHLYRVESSANDATPAGVTLTDKDEGGLYLVVNPVAHEDLSGTGTTATYEVTLTGGAIAAAGLKVTIDPSAADVQKDASGNYWYRWSANWDNVRPGNSGSTNNTFTASVKAVVPAGTTGWTTSDAGTAQSPAGRRVLKQTDLTGKFDDRIFNGAAQTGLPSNATTIASPTRIPATPPTTGHIHTITDLFQGDKTGAVGAISIQYANNAAGDTKEGNKTNVNMTEAVTTVTPPVQDWEPANKHDYYSYVSVAQGGLYLKLDQFAFGLNGQDGEWKITQAPTQIQNLQNKTTEQNVAVDLTTSNPKVRYQAANGNWVGTYPGQTGDYVTNQFDFTYAVTGWSGGTPVAGTDYDLVGTTFTPKSTGTFTITVTAKYKTGTAPQFKADLAEPPTNTFTVGGQMGNFTALQVEATRREATYGDAASAVSNPTTTAIWYVTTDTIGAPDNNQAKYFSLEGIKVTETWSNGNQTYDLSTLKPENITGITGGGVAEKGADGVLRIKFPDANGNQRQVTFKVKNTHPAKNGPGGTGDVTQTSTNTVTLILKARPLPYEVQATNSTKTNDADIDWTVKAEKLWNNNVTLTPGGDKARDGTPLRLRTVVTDPYALKDNVVINANGFKSRNPANTADDSTVGQDRAAVAKNAQPSGTYAKFYKTGTPTNDTIDIYPAHINPMEVEIDKPSTITVGDANLKSKVGVRVKQKNDESNQGGGNITFAPGTTITWEKWNSGGDNATYGKWEPDTSPIFQIDTLYRATVVLKADTNHYFHQGENDKFYNVNGFYNGDFSYLDPEWKKEASKVIVDVNEDDPLHDKLNVLYYNEVTISLVFDTSETPELHYSDGKGANNDTDYHHSHNKYVTHTEDVTIGDVTSDLVYTINLDAFTRPIFGVTVAVTDNNLTSQPGVTLTPTRPRANPSTSRTEMKLAGYKKDPLKPDDRDYDMDLDRISYTLTIPQALANTKGTYTLTLQARGASSQANVEANRYDVADNRYTFVLVVREQQKDPPPPIISGGGGGGTTVVEMPVVKYLVSDYGYTSDLTAEKLPKKGAKPSFVPKITALPGLKFLGWAETDPAQAKDGKLPTLVDPLTFSIDEDKVFYAVYERLEVSHSHYVIGFPDGTFGPDHHITRGQVATIIARACLEDFIEGGNYGNPGNYTDVEGHWANSAIAYCSMKGVFTGYTDGTFRPDRYISRQELATVVARLAGVQVNEGLPFSDNGEISSWALNGVYTNYVNGWVNGYTDGTFKPLNNITRAETVKIFNGYLNRGVDKEGLSELKEYVHQGVASNNTGNGTDEYMTWPDVAKTHWAYYEIIEAANDHNFRWRDATKAAPPEEWYEAFIDEVWRYDDNAEDGADDVGRDNTLPTLTVTYVVKSNGVIWESLTEEVTKFASPSVEKLPKAQASEGYRFAGWSETDPDEGEISLIDPTAHPVLEDKTFYAVFEPDVYVMPKITITYVIGDHGSTDMALSEVINLWQSPTVENLPKVTAHEGWTFKGWSETDPATGEVSLTDPTDHGAPGDSTFYAVYEPVQGVETPPEASPEPQEPPEPVESPEPSESPEPTESVTPPETTEPEPSESPEPTEPAEPAEPTVSPEPAEPAEPTEPVIPPETTEPEPSESAGPDDPIGPTESAEPVEYARTRYINGYTDDTFRPDDAFTRAAVATVIANLMGYDPDVTYADAGFDDLADHWGANAIHFCVEEGLLSGYTDNTFRPDNAISRQEFAIVLTRLAETTDVEPEELPFTDGEAIAPWALESVRIAYTKGWIGGYDDGTFLPERNVTRAEAVKMFNAYLGRSADPGRIEGQSGYTLWADVPTTHWAYYEIIEASNNWVE